jgi:hypothetical protein
LLILGGQLDLYGLQLLLQGSHVAWSGNSSRRESGRASSGEVSPEQGKNGMDIQISCITINDLK